MSMNNTVSLIHELFTLFMNNGHKRPSSRSKALGACTSVPHLPVYYRYFDCFDSFSGWYGMVVLQVVWLELRRLPPIMGFVGSKGQGW